MTNPDIVDRPSPALRHGWARKPASEPWSDDDDAFILAHAADMDPTVIGHRLGRSMEDVEARYRELKGLNATGGAATRDHAARTETPDEAPSACPKCLAGMAELMEDAGDHAVTCRRCGRYFPGPLDAQQYQAWITPFRRRRPEVRRPIVVTATSGTSSQQQIAAIVARLKPGTPEYGLRNWMPVHAADLDALEALLGGETLTERRRAAAHALGIPKGTYTLYRQAKEQERVKSKSSPMVEVARTPDAVVHVNADAAPADKQLVRDIAAKAITEASLDAAPVVVRTITVAEFQTLRAGTSTRSSPLQRSIEALPLGGGMVMRHPGGSHGRDRSCNVEMMLRRMNEACRSRGQSYHYEYIHVPEGEDPRAQVAVVKVAGSRTRKPRQAA